LSDIYKRICGKKSVHIALTQNSHIALKMACTARGLSMQEVLENFASKIELEDKKILNFLDQVKEEKLDKQNTKTFNKKQINDLFNILEDQDPLKD